MMLFLPPLPPESLLWPLFGRCGLQGHEFLGLQGLLVLRKCFRGVSQGSRRASWAASFSNFGLFNLFRSFFGLFGLLGLVILGPQGPTALRKCFRGVSQGSEKMSFFTSF